jgi:hypothetical protein
MPPAVAQFGPAQLFVFNILLIIVIQAVIYSDQMDDVQIYFFVFMAMAAMTSSILYSIKDTYKPTTIFASISAFVIFFSIIYQFNNSGSDIRLQAYKYATYPIGILGVLFGLAILYRGVVRAIENDSSIFGFILNLIFFIPCMLNDFIEYIKNEYNLTPPVVYILLAIEMILISLFVAISYIPKISMNLGGIPIVNETLFIDSKYTFKNVEKKTDNLLAQMKGDRRYAISLWTFVNQRTHLSDRKINIFSYGYENKETKIASWKPRIQFKGAENSHSKHKKDTYIITFATGVTSEIQLSSQKWHNFVFNYNGDAIDLFVDGNLERSFNPKEIPEYSESSDQFIIGDDSGVYGAICNVTFYDEPLTIREITSAFNLLNGRNPPINNL